MLEEDFVFSRADDSLSFPSPQSPGSMILTAPKRIFHLKVFALFGKLAVKLPGNCLFQVELREAEFTSCSTGNASARILHLLIWGYRTLRARSSK